MPGNPVCKPFGASRPVKSTFDAGRPEKVRTALRQCWLVVIALGAAGCVKAPEPVPQPIVWLTDEKLAAERSAAEQKPILVDFWATWCEACLDLDKHTYSDPRVQAYVNAHFVPLKVDDSETTDRLAALEKRFGVEYLPHVGVARPDGTVRKQPKIVGFLPPRLFLAELKKVEEP